MPQIEAKEQQSPAPTLTAPRNARIAQTLNAKNLLTQSGEHLRIASIQAPNMAETSGKMRPGQPMGKEATAALAALVNGKQLSIIQSTTEPTDRHGRSVALLSLPSGESLQARLIADGWAIAYPFPDFREYIREWQAHEDTARKAKLGIWAHPYWQVADALTLPDAEPDERYQLVEGVVKQAKQVRNNWYLNFGDDYRTDFTGFISKADAKRAFADMDIAALTGKRVRIRGWVYRRNGPSIDIALPEQIEVLDE